MPNKDYMGGSVQPVDSDFKPLGENFTHQSLAQKRSTIEELYGKEEAERFEARTINSLSQNGFNILEVAAALEISPNRIRHIKKKLKKAMSRELQELDANSFIGERLSFYKNAEEIALRNVQLYKKNPNMQRHFLDLALKAEADMHRLLISCGYYDFKKFDPGTAGYGAADDASEIKNAINMILSDGDFKADILEGEEDEEEYDLL